MSGQNVSFTDTVILGAGPYGLSLAAHLQDAGVPYVLLGEPMFAWKKTMPNGMFLLTEAFATNLWAPKSGYLFADYCRLHNIAYQRVGMMLPLQMFIDYALWFAGKLVSSMRATDAAKVEKTAAGFRVTTVDGAAIEARRVVLALGLQSFERFPDVLKSLPASHLSHSMGIRDYGWAEGKDVTIIGGGQSALGLAALMHEAGVKTRVLARDAAINWNTKPDFKRGWFSRLLKPEGGLGPGWRAHILVEYPWVFHAFGLARRRHIFTHSWGPSAAWWLRDRILGKVEMRVGEEVTLASMDGDRVALTVRDSAGSSVILTDHVVAATGFTHDLSRYAFLDPSLIAGMALIDGSPELNRAFETAVPGLHVIGPAAAQSFGPALRFLYGAKYAAPHLARHLARTAAREA